MLQSDPREFPALPPASVEMARLSHDLTLDRRTVAEETPVALIYDGSTAGVVMVTPADLEDLAIGFSLTEGIVQRPRDVQGLDVVAGPNGVELRVWLTPDCGRIFRGRQRRLVGPTGCGLCGIESLNEAARAIPPLTREISVCGSGIAVAVELLSAAQVLNRATRATHAAGFFVPGDRRLAAVREDVGRHNALDKLAGALAAQNLAGNSGAVILTSRVSVEMVQKTAMIGAGILIAISAPTALAVRTADACGMTLVGVARGREFEIFSHPDGIRPGEAAALPA